MTKLDIILRRSLSRFVNAINRDRWTGRREREAICLYVLAHLQKEVKPNTLFYDVRQIGIEMPVQQIKARIQKQISGGKGKPKTDVAKDLLIWRHPQMTTWTTDGEPHNIPLAIIEWKMGRSSPYEYDVKWLEEYSRRHAGFIGYAVSLYRSKKGVFSLGVTRVKQGKRKEDWLICNGVPAP